MELTIDIIRILRKLIKKIWLILVVTIIFAIIGYLYTADASPDSYRASVSLYSVAYGSYKESIEGFDAMTDYAEIVGSKKVADRVVNILLEYNLDAGTIQDMVKTSYQKDSAIFYISAYSENSKLTIDVANAVADAFIVEVRNITGEDSVKILDKAENVSLSFNGDRHQMITRLEFAAAGFFITCLIIIFIEIFNTKVSEINDGTLNGEIRLLGVIPEHNI